jgi:ATP sulfurylase
VGRRCDAILERYGPAGCVQASVLPAAMGYAGPREANFHSIMRPPAGFTRPEVADVLMDAYAAPPAGA